MSCNASLMMPIIVRFILLSVLALSGCGISPGSMIEEFLDPTTATDKTITVRVTLWGNSTDVEGTYSGSLREGKADGKGTFLCEIEDGKVSYTGDFSEGKIEGRGALDMWWEGSHMVSEGYFTNGALNGYGTATLYDGSDEPFVVCGTFTDGVFTPTVGEKYDYLGMRDLYGEFRLSEAQISFIDSHAELFPVAAEQYYDENEVSMFEYKHFTKTAAQPPLEISKIELYAIQVFEYTMADIDSTVTTILASDDEINCYAIYYLDSVEVYDGDSFVAYVLPVTASSFENRGGGTTEVVVMLASYIKG